MGSKTTTNEMPAFQQEFLEGTVMPFAKDFLAKDYQSFDGDRVAGQTPLQQQAMTGYGGLDMGAPLYGQAADTYGQALGTFGQAGNTYGDSAGVYGQSADMYGQSADMYGQAGQRFDQSANVYGDLATMQAPTVSETANMQGAQIGNVGSIAGADMASYMSPYTDSVIESGLRDLGGAQEMALNQQGAQATAANAFGGSRQGIAEAETRKAYGQQAADFIGKQRANAFNQAQQAAQFDLTGQQQRAIQQAQFNQQAGLTNLNANQQSRLANQQAALAAAGVRGAGAAGLGAAGAGRSNIAAGLGSNAAGIGSNAAGLGSNAAGFANIASGQGNIASGLADTAGSQLSSNIQGLGAQATAGETQRMLAQQGLDSNFQDFMAAQNFPLTQFGVLTGAAGAVPTGYGTTTTRDPMGTFGNLLAGAGAFGTGFPNLFGSDVRLKENIVSAGKISDVNFYRWNWNDKAKEIGVDKHPTFGVMAQELEKSYPEYVVTGEDGYRRVNYIGLYAELGV